MGDELSVLLKFRGDAGGAKQAAGEARAAISQLRQSSTADLKGIQTASTASLGSVTQSLSQITAGIPGVGRAFSGLSSQLTTVSEAATGAETGIAAMAGPIAAAAIGIGVMVGAVISLGKELFNLTKQTAEFEGKFQDLSQQVGVSVETLSTLDVIASTTGGSIETVTASLGIFQKNLEAAHAPTSKQSKLLKELGVTSLDTETALRQTIKGLFALGEGEKQTAASLELFGRGGRFVNAILKESGGDLDAATAKFQELGLVISGPAAAAADQFNDQLEIIGRQLSAVAYKIGNQTIPIFAVLFEDISKALAESSSGWQSWESVIETTTAAAIAHVKAFVEFIESRGTLDYSTLFFIERDSLLQRARALRTQLQIEDVTERAARLAESGGAPGDRPDGKKAAAEAAARAAKEIAISQRALEESTRFNRAVLERERDLDLKSIEEWLTASNAAANQYLKDQQEIFNQERANAERFIAGRQDLALALQEIDQKETKAQNDFILTTIKNQDEANKRRAQLELNLNRQLSAIRDAAREGERQRVQDDLDRSIIVESEAISRQLALLKDEHEQRLTLLNLELGQITISAERKIEIDNLKLESEQRYTDAVERLTRLRIEALNKEQAERQAAEIQGRTQRLSPDDIAAQAGAAANAATVDLIAGADAVAEANLRHLETVNTLKDAYQGFASSLGSGVGQIIQSLVLMGKVGPDGFRKVTAAALASVSARAAADAIYELAIGFAALTPWGAAVYGPAGFHFHAAALLGGIALGAGAAGRVAAGNLFSQGSSGSSGGNGSRAGNGGNTPPSPIDLIRPQQREEIHIFVHSEPGPGFPDNIINTVIRDVQRNGPVRDLIIRTSES